MSILFERNNSGDQHRIERSGFGSVVPIYNSPAEFTGGDVQDDEEEDDRSSSSLSSSSSIGKNSDDSPSGRSSSCGGGDRDEDCEEVQSTFKPGGLDNLVALEEVLPAKKSISMFYAGKSKSFTSLADAASISSVKEIVKPEDAYTKKRKNLLAHSNFYGKNRCCIPGIDNRGMYKRPINSRSSSALAASMSCSGSNYSSGSNYNSESLNSSPSSPCFSRPPLPPQSRKCSKIYSLSPPEQKFSAWRSFSLSDLQGAAATTTPSLMGIKE